MIEAVRNAFRLPDLRRKLLITLGILVIYRLASHVPVPGVNREALSTIFEPNQLLGLLNLLSGGALQQLLGDGHGGVSVHHGLHHRAVADPDHPAPGGAAARKASRATQAEPVYQLPDHPAGAVAGVRPVIAAGAIRRHGGGAGATRVWLPARIRCRRSSILVTLTAGTMLAMWLGQLITEQGIGNGVSIIIFGGIIAGMPQNVQRHCGARAASCSCWSSSLVTVLTVAVIVVVQEGQRRIPVQYGKRVRAMRGNRLMVVGGQSTHVPLRVNSAGMIPLIFASSFLIFPSTIASYFVNSPTRFVRNGRELHLSSSSARVQFAYWILYFVLVSAFTYFYTDVVFRQQNLAETLQRQGGFIPGIRPGPQHRAVSEPGAVADHPGGRAVPGLGGDLAVAGALGLLVGGAAAARQPARC